MPITACLILGKKFWSLKGHVGTLVAHPDKKRIQMKVIAKIFKSLTVFDIVMFT